MNMGIDEAGHEVRQASIGPDFVDFDNFSLGDRQFCGIGFSLGDVDEVSLDFHGQKVKKRSVPVSSGWIGFPFSGEGLD